MINPELVSYHFAAKPRGPTARTDRTDVQAMGDAFCLRCKEVRLGQVRVHRGGRVTFHRDQVRRVIPNAGVPADGRYIVTCRSCGVGQIVDYEGV